MQVATFGTAVLDMSDFPSRPRTRSALFQNEIERIMAGWLTELPAQVRYGREVTGFTQDDPGVEVQLADGEALRAQYLVGCDGGRSLIRKLAGIDFPGWEATRSNLIAEVELAEPEVGLRHDAFGVQAIGPIERGFRVVLTEPELRSGEASMDDLRAALVRVYGTDSGSTARSGSPLHRRDAPGRGLPLRARAARRRRGPHPLSRRRAGSASGCRTR